MGSMRWYLPLPKDTKWNELHRKMQDTNSSVEEWERAIKMRKLQPQGKTSL